MKYNELNLEAPIQRAVDELGFEEPTPIQQQAIPIIREGKDLIGQSETGSGKTAAFGLPILEKVKPISSLQAIILAPTRELTDQIARNLASFSKYKPVKIVVIYGGVSINPQIDNIPKADIIVGTPGRVLDHLRRRTLSLSDIKFCVLDEADKMFEMGFVEDVNAILKFTSRNKQMIIFSATISNEVQKIASRFMNNPAKVKTSTHISAKTLQQIYYNVRRNEKFSLLVHLIKEEKPELALVFCGTRTETHIVAKNLAKQGIEAVALHGGLSQNKRNNIMDDFKAGKINVLVASDVAARGIDVKHLTHIINYSIPKTSHEYIHRIGRTARIGHAGIAINLLEERDYNNFNRVLDDRSLKIEKRPLPDFKKIEMPKPQFNKPFKFSQGRSKFRNRETYYKFGRNFKH
ncbi:DEAD/DEAH box helicase [Candidatus Woesearchaeota archaeon]|nr:DEAD/DEAH box helicase [Candidatus Woesearchaeota archaeon]